MSRIEAFHQTLRRTTLWGAWVGGALMLASALLVSLDVLLRGLIGWSMAGADELASYAFAMATTLALSFALVDRAHIRIDAAYNFAPDWMKILLDLLAMAALTAFLAVASYYAFGIVAHTFENDAHSITPLRTPLIYPQTIWLFGLGAATVTGAVLFVTAALATFTGQRAMEARLAGTKSIEDQIEEESGVSAKRPSKRPVNTTKQES